MARLRILIYCLLVASGVGAQSTFHDTSIFAAPISLDSVTVRSSRKGWDIGAFIRRVQTDTTFFRAFKGIRFVSYRATNDIKILDKNGGTKASLFSHTKQNVVGNCRTMQVEDEKTTGNFYTKKRNYNWYTAELYAYLFFTKGKICESDNPAGMLDTREEGAMGKAKWQLEQLIFRPGSKVKGVPFIGDKASIFEPDIARMYEFKLQSVIYAGEECWLFSAFPKPEYKSDVVYNELSTWFRKSDYSIMARDYSLSYHTLLFDFDVAMKVRLQPVAGKLRPIRIDYDGNWHVAMKDRERAKFTALFQY